MIRDYPQTKTQQETDERHWRRRGKRPPTELDEQRIKEAQAKRERRQHGAD